jgi:hypothetical protein
VENYFNYFTEIEECYRRCRNTPSLLSPLDWALIESWKEAGIPLEAVLAGIERSFTKFQKRPARLQRINSIAYCTQQILTATQEMKDGGASAKSGSDRSSAPPFTPDEILRFLHRNAAALEQAAKEARESQQSVLAEDVAGVAASLRETATKQAASPAQNLQELELMLSALEEKVNAALSRAADVDLLAKLRGEVARGLGSSRSRMTAVQIESLERQFLKKRLFEHFRIPRLSLFYL